MTEPLHARGSTGAVPAVTTSEERPRGAGERLYDLVAELYPICRSITGDGVRRSLDIIGRRIPLTRVEVPTGTRLFDWIVPHEWNIRDGYIKNARGERVVDFNASNLHVVNYSTPVHATVPIAALRRHLFSLPGHPSWIPYRTSYYQETWGFCVTHRQLAALTDDEYEVLIDASLTNGSLTYAECYLPGRTADEVLVSAHVCHPSLCNDNLSGISVAVALAQHLLDRPHRYSYRFLFAPGTIGAIAWLARNRERAGAIKHGLVLTCVGDRGAFHYKKSRRGNAEIDRTFARVMAESGVPHEILEFSPTGYDERQYCSPGFNLPVGCLMRSVWGQFPEYHTSADDLRFVAPEALEQSYLLCRSAIDVLEENRVYASTNPFCEPALGRRGLYGTTGDDAAAGNLARLWTLNLADGTHSLLDVADRSGLAFGRIADAAHELAAHGLLVERDRPRREADVTSLRPRSGNRSPGSGGGRAEDGGAESFTRRNGETEANGGRPDELRRTAAARPPSIGWGPQGGGIPRDESQSKGCRLSSLGISHPFCPREARGTRLGALQATRLSPFASVSPFLRVKKSPCLRPLRFGDSARIAGAAKRMNVSDWRNRRVLVTGARGFIASHLCRRLVAAGAAVYGVSRQPADGRPGLAWIAADLTDSRKARDVLARLRPDVVFHLAGRVVGAQGVEHVEPTFQMNLASTVHVLTAAVDTPCRIVLTGSMQEPHAGDPSPVPPSPYAASKWACTAYARMFHALYGLPVAIARPFMVYGPGQWDHTKVLPYAILSLLRGEPPRIGSGARQLDWVYVDDVVEGLLMVGASPCADASPVDLGTGVLTSVRDVIEQVRALLGSDVAAAYGARPDRPLERPHAARAEETRRLTGWAAATPLEEGLSRTVQWYRAQLMARAG